MDELMLKIDSVSKQYKLGQIGGTTLRDELQRLRAKRRGEEDPTKRIGAKNYNQGETFLALDGVSFEVKKGERVGIIGHNGAGKSTLLKLISRVTAPSGGTIGMNGRVASMLEVGTGFHGELTGRENIYMNGAILGMTKKEIDAKMEAIIDFSEVRQFIDTPVKRYSSGMYVKLAFSVAAHLDSEIMIMDEVLAVGDIAFQKKCLEKMNDVSKSQGRTILYVSHNMDTIKNLCNRCIVLDHGKSVYDGSVERGISMYLGNYEQFKRSYTYTNEFHKNIGAIGGIRINQLSFLDTEKGIFKTGDRIRVKLIMNVEHPFQQLMFRFVWSFEGSSVCGTMLSQKPISLEAGVEKNIILTVDMDHLMDGRYKVDIIAFEKNEYGAERVVDGVYPGFFIEIQNSVDEKCPIVWYPQYWGNTMLHCLTID